jgi:excisionase family DNA binding protein
MMKRRRVLLRNVRPVCKGVRMARYVTPDEAAAHLGISTRTVRRRIADGTIPAYRLGPRLLRIDLDELAAATKEGAA